MLRIKTLKLINSLIQVPRTESFTVSRSENQNFLPDGKVELESTVQMTLQQKSILHESDLNRRSAATSVCASGLQTPKVSSFVYHENDRISQSEDNAGMPEDSIQFPASPMPLEVVNLYYTSLYFVYVSYFYTSHQKIAILK